MAIKRAEKIQAKLRLALIGPTGSGKTYTGLAIGQYMARAENTKMGVIDTERNSACLYSDNFTFDVEADIHEFSPRTYVEKIREFASLGYGVLFIDSLSHAWNGSGGALEMVDKAADRSKGGNKFACWRDVTPEHNKMVDAILSYPGHVIVSVRSKMEYVQEKDDRGKTTIRKVGLQPVQRDGLEYEFTVVGDVDMDHKLIITKSRCSAIADGVFPKAGGDVAKTLLDWLNSGITPQEPASPTIHGDNEQPKDEIADDEAWMAQIDATFSDMAFSPSEASACVQSVIKSRKWANVLSCPPNLRPNFLQAIRDGKYETFKAAAVA